MHGCDGNKNAVVATEILRVSSISIAAFSTLKIKSFETKRTTKKKKSANDYGSIVRKHAVDITEQEFSKINN